MTHHKHPSEEGPLSKKQGEVIEFASASREHPRKTDVPIERFLISEEGREEMARLFTEIDSSGFIIRTLAMDLEETLDSMLHNGDPTIYALFMHDDGAEGLTRLELIDLYKSNPLINATLWASRRKHHDGDYRARQIYTYGLRIFMNMVRYEWLMRTYDPNDPHWEDRASRLGDFRGNMLHLNLQPGFNRGDLVPRNHTPSDYLESLPED